jgi:hypothetical protein
MENLAKENIGSEAASTVISCGNFEMSHAKRRSEWDGGLCYNPRKNGLIVIVAPFDRRFVISMVRSKQELEPRRSRRKAAKVAKKFELRCDIDSGQLDPN